VDGSGNVIGSTSNALNVNLSSSGLSNQSVNEAQINGVTPLMGNGTSGTGAQRVTLASDSTGQVTLASGTTTAVTQATASSLNAQVVGSVASGSSDSGNPVKMGGVAINAEQTAVTNGQRVNGVFDLTGRFINFPYANKENIVRGCATSTGTSDTSLIAAQGSGVKFYMVGYMISNIGGSAVNSGITFKDGPGGSTIWVSPAAANTGSAFVPPLPLSGTANTALYFAASTASTTITVCAVGFKGT
jgi:hypothetical protein